MEEHSNETSAGRTPSGLPDADAQSRFWETGLLALVWLGWFAVVAVLGALLKKHITTITAYYAVSGVGELLLLLPAILFIWKKRISLKQLFGRPAAVQVAAGAVAGALMVPAFVSLTVFWSLLIRLTGGALPAEARFPIPTTAADAALALAVVGLAAPLVEEPLMRGLLLNAGGGALGRNRALVLVSVIFSLLHGQLTALPQIFAAGLVLGILAWHSGSLWPSIAAHGAYNAASLAMGLLLQSIKNNVAMQAQATTEQLAAALLVYVPVSLPFLAALALVLWGVLRHSPGVDRPLAEARAVPFRAAWPWLAVLVLLIVWIALDGLQVYGIIIASVHS